MTCLYKRLYNFDGEKKREGEKTNALPGGPN